MKRLYGRETKIFPFPATFFATIFPLFVWRMLTINGIMDDVFPKKEKNQNSSNILSEHSIIKD